MNVSGKDSIPVNDSGVVNKDVDVIEISKNVVPQLLDGVVIAHVTNERFCGPFVSGLLDYLTDGFFVIRLFNVDADDHAL